MSSRAENSLFTLPGYEIQEKLGEGGMGVVFKAHDKKLQRQVAIKFLYQDGDASKDTNQVLQEARRLAQVNHPNVVSIYELCETQTETKNRSAIVMEYLQGAPLAAINKEQLLSQNQKLSYLIQIAQGMIAIHQAGLRHGDLKAENVWITDDNKVKLLDFGLSTEIDSQPSAADTSDYSSASLTTLSPEFCLGQPLTQQTDIFNFGCLACQLLTDKLPFNTSTQEATQQALCKGELASASQLSPALPGALAQVLDHCLQPTPEQRPDNFALLHQQLLDIEEALKQQQQANNATMVFEPVASAAEQPAETTHKSTVSSAKKNKILAVFASVVLLATISVFVWHQSNQPPPEKSVLVFPAKMTGEAEMPPEQIRMIKAALDNTLRDSVINTRALNLISRSELDSVADDLNSSLKATGASNALQPLVDCQGTSCQITIELIDGSSALIKNQVRWHSPALDVYEISTIAQSYFQQLFPDYPMTDNDVIPVSKEAYEEFARLYAELQFNAGDTELHLAELGELLEENPYLFSGYRLYRDFSIKMYYDSGEKSFIEELEEIILISPEEYIKTPNYLLDLFSLKLAQNKLDDVEKLILETQINGLDSITSSELKGAFYLQTGDAEKSKTQLELSLNSRFSAVTLYNLALCHWELGELDLGILRLQELLTISPGYYFGEQLLASFYLYSGQLNKAVTLFEQFVANDPETFDLSNLGLTYLLNGNIEKALFYSQKAFEKSPQNTALILNLADIQSLAGKRDKANEKYLNLINKLEDKSDVDSLLVKAQAYVHLGNNIMATKTLSDALKISPDNSEAMFIASLIYTRTSQYPLAIVKAEESLNAGYGEIWYHLPWFTPLCEFSEYISLFETKGRTGNSPCVKLD